MVRADFAERFVVESAEVLHIKSQVLQPLVYVEIKSKNADQGKIQHIMET